MRAANWIEDMGRSERRHWPRYDLAGGLPVTMTADGMTWDCLLEDVSLGGARVRLDRPAPRNLEVRIEHPTAGSVYGARTWAGAGRMGVQFDLSPQALDLITHCLMQHDPPRSARVPPAALSG
jgi:hypothetical protein